MSRFYGALLEWNSLSLCSNRTSIASAIQEPVEFHGSQTSASEALRMGWAAWRAAMRSWGISCTEQLTTWLRDISARAQEFIIHEACTADARAALLETVFVLITLHQRRASGVPPVTRASHTATRRTASAVPSEVPGRCWEQLDQVNLAEWFLKRIPILKTCPHFLRGRLRQCFTVALRERYRARQSGDIQAEGFWAGPNDVNASTKRIWIGGSGRVGEAGR